MKLQRNIKLAIAQSLLLAAIPALVAQIQTAPTTPNPMLKSKRATASPANSVRVLVTVVNLAGASRQAVFGKNKINLPIGQRVVLQVHPGDTMHVVSDMDSKVNQSFVIAKNDEARVLTIK